MITPRAPSETRAAASRSGVAGVAHHDLSRRHDEAQGLDLAREVAERAARPVGARRERAGERLHVDVAEVLHGETRGEERLAQVVELAPRGHPGESGVRVHVEHPGQAVQGEQDPVGDHERLERVTRARHANAVSSVGSRAHGLLDLLLAFRAADLVDLAADVACPVVPMPGHACQSPSLGDPSSTGRVTGDTWSPPRGSAAGDPGHVPLAWAVPPEPDSVRGARLTQAGGVQTLLRGEPMDPSNEARNRELLSQSDPDVYAALVGEEGRQRRGIELIPSENYTWPEVLTCNGSVFTNKYAEGYPGRRYYGGNEFTDHDRTPRAQARQGAVPLRARQRAAALGLADEPGGVSRVHEAGRHHPRHGSLPRRAPDPRRARLAHGQDLQLRALQDPPRRAGAHRLRRGDARRQGDAAEDRALRLHLVPARSRLRGVQGGRRRGGRPHHGRRLPRRRADRGRRHAQPLRRRLRPRHHHHPQEPARALAAAWCCAASRSGRSSTSRCSRACKEART